MLLTLLLLACPASDRKVDPSTTTGEGLFLHGCPTPDRAGARVLTDIAEAPWGPDALAAPGDVVLFNERAAFVIQDPGFDPAAEGSGTPRAPRTYYHYGGLPIDAVAVDGCAQAGPEILGEVGLLVGQLDLADFTASTLHMVRGEMIDVVSDGSDGGPAIVEVSATDDRFWLVELTLMRSVYASGGRKELGPLYGLDLTLRYTLEPDDGALQLDVLLDGDPITDEFLVGALLFPSDHTQQHRWASGAVSVGGFGLDVGIPWIEDASPVVGGGATALAMRDANLAVTEISGVTAMLDMNQVASPVTVGDEVGFLLSVGPTGGASAAAALEPYLEDPVPGTSMAWTDVSGTVTDPDGAPVCTTVEVLTADASGDEDVLTTLVSGTDGRFAGRVLAADGSLRLRAVGSGRDDGQSLEAAAGASTDLALAIGHAGSVEVVIVDDAGAALPVRVELERQDGTVVVGYPTPDAPFVDVPPGTYTAYVTRGYEYAPLTTDVTVRDDGTGPSLVSGALSRVIDTDGWISYDSHVHGGPSADSDVLPVTRMQTAAASGLDLVISTDHEVIEDWSDAITEAGLGDHLVYGLGSEITASIPEHTNAWPFPSTEIVRGDPVVWYERGFPGIYAAERARGARVIQLNHSRVNGECGVLCLLEWDRMTDPPASADLPALGISLDDEVWSWDFDAFEVLNGLRSPFLTDDPRRSGALYDWLAFHNLGYRVTAVGVTDVHGLDIPGAPATYVNVPDESAFDADDAADATLAGAAQVSAGAFARVTVDGGAPGQTVTVTDGEAELAVNVQALPGIDVQRVEVLVDCDAAMTLTADAAQGLVKLDARVPLPVTRDHYVVVIALGDGEMPRGLLGYDAASVPRVLVNPVFIDGDGDGVWTAPGPKACDWRP